MSIPYQAFCIGFVNKLSQSSITESRFNSLMSKPETSVAKKKKKKIKQIPVEEALRGTTLKSEPGCHLIMRL